MLLSQIHWSEANHDRCKCGDSDYDRNYLPRPGNYAYVCLKSVEASKPRRQDSNSDQYYISRVYDPDKQDVDKLDHYNCNFRSAWIIKRVDPSNRCPYFVLQPVAKSDLYLSRGQLRTYREYYRCGWWGWMSQCSRRKTVPRYEHENNLSSVLDKNSEWELDICKGTSSSSGLKRNNVLIKNRGTGKYLGWDHLNPLELKSNPESDLVLYGYAWQKFLIEPYIDAIYMSSNTRSKRTNGEKESKPQSSVEGTPPLVQSTTGIDGDDTTAQHQDHDDQQDDHEDDDRRNLLLVLLIAGIIMIVSASAASVVLLYLKYKFLKRSTGSELNSSIKNIHDTIDKYDVVSDDSTEGEEEEDDENLSTEGDKGGANKLMITSSFPIPIVESLNQEDH